MHIINIHPQREKGRDRQTDRQTDQQTDRQTETELEPKSIILTSRFTVLHKALNSI